MNRRVCQFSQKKNKIYDQYILVKYGLLPDFKLILFSEINSMIILTNDFFGNGVIDSNLISRRYVLGKVNGFLSTILSLELQYIHYVIEISAKLKSMSLKD